MNIIRKAAKHTLLGAFYFCGMKKDPQQQVFWKAEMTQETGLE
jgi:hypothetical protein